MHTITVALGDRSYPILVGERLLAEAGAHIATHTHARRVIVVTEEIVARLYLHRLTGALETAGISARTIVLPPGESTKSFAQFETLVERILEQKPDRNTVLVALGGGVIGDITGFAASVCLRGLSFVQIPTTLLAMVDSAVGGKTAINSRFGKNLIGAFHQPRLVLADVGTLGTLPHRELLAGYAETVKYGLIQAPDFFAWLEQHGSALLAGNASAREHAVLESCNIKARIVAADEHETQDVRALLNFGHTFAHALEAETGYSDQLLHGEAVAIGMMLAMETSVALGHTTVETLARMRAHWQSVGLPGALRDVSEAWNIDALIEHFSRDKKARDQALTFVLARGIGQAFVAHPVAPEAVRQALVESAKIP